MFALASMGVLFAGHLSGCSKPPTANATSANAASSSKTDDAATAPDPDPIGKLEARVAALEAQQRLQQLINESDDIAYLTTDNKNWSSIKTSIGYLAVSLEDVKDYANGSQITLSIGNPTSATIAGVSAHLEWGSTDSKGSPIGETHEKDVEFAESLPAASWQRIAIPIPNVLPKDLGYVRIRNLSFKTISLRTIFSAG